MNFVSTIDGDSPSCRPFGDPVLFDNKIYVLTSKPKNVSKQIDKNNNVCIVAYDGENWIRIKCKLIDDSNNVVVCWLSSWLVLYQQTRLRLGRNYHLATHVECVAVLQLK